MEIKFEPLTSLSYEDFKKYVHVHETKDGMKRSTNLTGDVRIIAESEELPTLYYEFVENKPNQKYDESTPSQEIHPDLRIKETVETGETKKDEETGEEVPVTEEVETGAGWIMHALVKDIAMFNLSKNLGGGESNEPTEPTDPEEPTNPEESSEDQP